MRLILWATVSFGIAAVGQAQHDGARDAVRHIASGRFDQVEKTLQKKRPFAGEAESAFVQMLSLLAQNRPSTAMVKARSAVELGLPFERLLVGPREQLRKLHAFKKFRAWQQEVSSPLLIHGPMIGNVRHDSASIWVRTYGEQEVRLNVAGATSRPRSTTSVDNDFTAVLTVDGLQPSREYRYEINVGEENVSTGKFSTFPAADTPAKFSVGFGGGAGYVPEWERMWDTVLSFFAGRLFHAW